MKKDVERRALLQICFGWPRTVSSVVRKWNSVYLFVFFTNISSDNTGIWTGNLWVTILASRLYFRSAPRLSLNHPNSLEWKTTAGWELEGPLLTHFSMWNDLLSLLVWFNMAFLWKHLLFLHHWGLLDQLITDLTLCPPLLLALWWTVKKQITSKWLLLALKETWRDSAIYIWASGITRVR